MSEGKDSTFSRQQQLVMNNPFTVHNNDPKWPDGLTSNSMGNKHVRVTEVKGPTHLIVIFPGLLNWMQCYSYLDASFGFQLTANHGLTEPDLIEYRSQTTSAGAANPVTSSYISEQTNKVVEWRPVSIGLRMYCGNNDRENDGFIECVRVPHGHLNEYFAMVYPNGSHPGRSGLPVYPNLSPETAWVTDADTGTQTIPGADTTDYIECKLATGHVVMSSFWINRLVNHARLHPFRLQNLPGYNILPISDLSDYQFLLNPSNHYNEFNAVKDYVDTNAVYASGDAELLEVGWQTVWSDSTSSYVPLGTATATPKYYWKYRVATNLGERFIEMSNNETFTASSFDCIIIRVHGTSKTRLLLHSSACMEYICTNKQQTGVTPTYADPNLVKRQVENRNTYNKYAYDLKSTHPDTKY
jgi:hypothetical protein